MKEIVSYLNRIEPASWLKGIVYSLLIVIIYIMTLKWLILHDWPREDYSYACLIPFVVLYLLWEKRETLASLPSKPSWMGLLPFGLGLGLFWLGELAGEFFSQYLSLWLILVGICWMHLGWQKLKTIGFACFMMLAMFPFPYFINTKISLAMKLISSQLGVWMLQLYGMSAYREGNVIDLGFTQLQVVDACSGLRYLFPLMVLSLILAYWFRARFWKRAILFLSSIPIAIFVNSFRIALTGVLYSFWGPAVAEGFFHGFSGWLIFLFTTGILLAEMWVLKKIGKEADSSMREEDENKSLENSMRNGEGNERIGDARNWRKKLLQPQFLAVVAVLGLTFGLSQGVEFRGKVPAKHSFSQFPLQIGEWNGTRETMEQAFIDELDLSDYVIVNYRNKQNHAINFYTAYYESQQKGESIHSPETCLPGSGWKFGKEEEVSFKTNNGGTMRVNRVFMEKDGEKQLAYFWFPQRGRVLTKLYQLKLYNFWDALTRQRTDGALIRVITPIASTEKPEDAEARIRGFLNDAIPILSSFIPN